jgi:hypothetical protein
MVVVTVVVTVVVVVVVVVVEAGGGRSFLAAILAWTLSHGFPSPTAARQLTLLLLPWIRTAASRSDSSSSVQEPRSLGTCSPLGFPSETNDSME